MFVLTIFSVTHYISYCVHSNDSINALQDNHDAVRSRIEQKVNAINDRNTGSHYVPPRKRRRYRKYRNDVAFYHRHHNHSDGDELSIADLNVNVKEECPYSSPSDVVPECFTGIDHPRSTKGTKGNKLFVWQWYITNKEHILDEEFQQFVYHKMNEQLSEEQKWGDWDSNKRAWSRLIEHIRRIKM